MIGLDNGNPIVSVLVDRSVLAEELLAKTGRNLYVDPETIRLMPRGEGGDMKIRFFRIGRWVSDEALSIAFDKRNLDPVDPFSLIIVNIAFPEFADTYRNATHWRDADGTWRYLTFRKRIGGRAVTANRNYMLWQSFWWYGGVPKRG